MKLSINKKLFLQSWGLAERSTSSSSSMSILSSVLVKASQDQVTLQATDIRTSIICTASGINVLEPGEAVFPVKIVSELFKKAPAGIKELEIIEGGEHRLRTNKECLQIIENWIIKTLGWKK